MVKLGELSIFRTELMGISALCLLICHLYGYVDLSVTVRYILSLGNVGVDLFLFLSGMGMWNSLSKTKYGEIKYWYIHRYLKLFVPYLVAILPFDILRYALGQPIGSNFVDYLFGLSTIRFYVSHDAPWFIAALIPLYFFSPLFYRLIMKYQWKAVVILVLVLYLGLFVPTSFRSGLLNDVIENIQFVAVRAPAFVLGIALGQSINENKQLPLWGLIILSILGILIIIITHHLVYGYFFIILPLLFVLCKLIKSCGKWGRVFFQIMGKISLESYILNGVLPKLVVAVFVVLNLPSIGNIIPYIIACLVSIPIGYGFHKISMIILDNIRFSITK